MDTINNSNQEKEEGIDIVDMILQVWRNRIFVLKVTAAFLVLSILVVLFSEKRYSATTVMVPQIEEKQTGGRLGGLASIVGIDLNSIMNTEVLPPAIYPQVMNSTPFMKELMHTPLTFSAYDKPISLYEYYTERRRPNIFQVIRKYTIGLPGLIVSAIRKPEEVETGKLFASDQILSYTKKEFDVASALKKVLRTEIDPKQSTITINSTFPDKYAVAHMVRKAQVLLQEHISEYKLEKVSSNLLFLEERFIEAKYAYDSKQNEYAEFLDTNKGLSTAVSRIKLSQLENEVALNYSIYSELAMQLEKTRIAQKEVTPLLTIIDPVVVPINKSHPQTIKTIVIYIFMGFMLSTMLIVIAPYVGREFGYEKLENLFK